MRTMDTDTRTQIQTKEEALDRRFVFHPFTQLDQHRVLGRAGDRLGPGRRRSPTAAAAPTSTRWPASGASTSATAAARSPRPCARRRCGSATTTPSRRWRPTCRRELAERVLGDVPGRRCRRSSSATAAPTRTTRRSSSSGTTTTSSAGPEKKKIISRDRGYHGVTVVSASLTGLRRCTTASTCRCRWSGTRRRRYQPLGAARQGESDEAFAQRLADELEQLILAEGPGHRRRLHRRAAPGRGRRDPAARGRTGRGSRRCFASTTCC